MIYAIALRGQLKRLEDFNDFFLEHGHMLSDDEAYAREDRLDAKGLDIDLLKADIENGRDEIEGLRHGVVIAGDSE